MASNSESILWMTLTGVYTVVAYAVYQYNLPCHPLLRALFGAWNTAVTAAATAYFSQQQRTLTDRNTFRATFHLSFNWVCTAIINYYIFLKIYAEKIQDKAKQPNVSGAKLGYSVPTLFKDRANVRHDVTSLTMLGAAATSLLIFIWTVLTVSATQAPETSGNASTGQFLTWWSIANIIVSAVSLGLLVLLMVPASKEEFMYTVWIKHQNVFSSMGLSSRPVFVLFPTELITVMNLCIAATLMVFYRDYAQVMMGLMLLIVFPQIGCALHRTLAAWKETLQFSIMIWTQIFFVFPAIFQRGRSIVDFAASNITTAADLHLVMPSDDSNTRMHFRNHWGANNSLVSYEHTRTFEISLVFSAIVLIPLTLFTVFKNTRMDSKVSAVPTKQTVKV